MLVLFRQLVRQALLLLSVFGVLGSPLARANTEICNTSDDYPIVVAMAYQEVSILHQPFHLQGWHTLAPGDCKQIIHGDANGYLYYIRARAGKVILGPEANHSATSSDQQFCVRNDAFDKDGVGGGVERECEVPDYLAAFPIVITNPDFDAKEISIDLNPDSTIKNAAGHAESAGGGLGMPSLYGAVAVSSDARLTARYLLNSPEDARSEALKECRKYGGADCHIVEMFHDGCVSLLNPKKARWMVAAGGVGWTKEQTEAYGFAECRRKGDTCKDNDATTVCSTWPEKHAHENAFEEDMQNKALDVMGRMLNAIPK